MDTELLIVGGGPGGYVAAIRAGQMGLDVTLVEKAAYGGTCLNTGCIPSKAFISATDIAHRAREASRMGIDADPSVDMTRMVRWKDGVVRRLTKGVESLCEGAGVTLREGRAEFVDDDAVRVIKQDGSETEISFENAIIATGSRPVDIPGFAFDGESVLSSADAFELESIPEQLVVIGAGYIGMELATVFGKLGCDVVVLEQLPNALPGYEEDVTDVVVSRAESVGVEFHFEHGATGWEQHEGGVTVLAEDETGEETAFDAERCLVAVGREPVTETVNLDVVGVDTDDNGFVETDDRTATTAESVFAVGDVAGEPMLAHAAFHEGEVAARVAAGESATLDDRTIPAAVFTDPEIATVGTTESEAREAGFEPVVGQMPLRASGRASTLDEREGFVRVVASDDGVIRGGQIVAPEASELIAELTLAVEHELTLADLAATVHVHPTLSEAVHEAVLGAEGESIHY
jgi:dihydrolipoamide dehydrogenase